MERTVTLPFVWEEFIERRAGTTTRNRCYKATSSAISILSSARGEREERVSTPAPRPVVAQHRVPELVHVYASREIRIR